MGSLSKCKGCYGVLSNQIRYEELMWYYSVFHKMSENITVASTVVHDERMAPAEIDRCLNSTFKLQSSKTMTNLMNRNDVLLPTMVSATST
jgi:hypothetical protein